ncbi:hypothetical protein [Massilia sp. DD77]|uniref:hypothetical protein n=1 Tax=Massilia sp. DD77 TaxID=3109349 RepID=UPI002FFD8411
MKKQWEGQYLEDAIADEIALAAIHPKVRRRAVKPTSPMFTTDVYPKAAALGGHWGSAHSPRTTIAMALPHWRRKWAAAGPLIGEFGLSVRQDDEEGTVSVGNGSRRRDVIEAYADHPDKDAAICAAIVRAAIRVITEAREQN